MKEFAIYLENFEITRNKMVEEQLKARGIKPLAILVTDLY